MCKVINCINCVSTNTVCLILGVDVANVILQPENQVIYSGQNAFFFCRLNGTNGRLLPVQWSIIVIDSPRIRLTMNTSEYLILPPVNSVLAIVRPTRMFSVLCSGGTKEYTANLQINGE